jgi:hypothetical protein
MRFNVAGAGVLGDAVSAPVEWGEDNFLFRINALFDAFGCLPHRQRSLASIPP